MSPHLGRDFSSYQGNLTDADCEGIDFAYVKATEGADYKNPYAPQQTGMLRSHGVEVGFYHFFQPADPVLDQLHNFQLMVSALGGTKLPLALDSEVQSNLGWPTLATRMMDFATGVESFTNFIPNPRSLLYVNLNFYDSLQGFPWGRWVWLADPNAGAPHRPCLILQQAPRPVSGTDLKVVDPDVFMGTDAQWLQFTGAPAPAPSQPVADLPTVPGPNGLQLVILGKMGLAGEFTGHNVIPGTTVYAGLGDPTIWVVGQNTKHLPPGTPLAVAYSDRDKITQPVVTEQL